MLIIDGFEGELAVVEYSSGPEREIFTLPRKVLPAGAKEGDLLLISIDREGSIKRKEEIKKLSDELFE